MLGPNEDGAEKYDEYLESLPEPPPNIVAILKPRNKAGSGRPMLIMARLEYDEISQPFDNEYVVRYAPFSVFDDLLVRAMNAEGQLRVAQKQLSTHRLNGGKCTCDDMIRIETMLKETLTRIRNKIAGDFCPTIDKGLLVDYLDDEINAVLQPNICREP